MKKAISWILTFVLLLPPLGCSSDPAASITYSMKIDPEFEISASDGLVVVHVAAKNAPSISRSGSALLLFWKISEKKIFHA